MYGQKIWFKVTKCLIVPSKEELFWQEREYTRGSFYGMMTLGINKHACRINKNG
jgi:hypothetical protein